MDGMSRSELADAKEQGRMDTIFRAIKKYEVKQKFSGKIDYLWCIVIQNVDIPI